MTNSRNWNKDLKGCFTKEPFLVAEAEKTVFNIICHRILHYSHNTHYSDGPEILKDDFKYNRKQIIMELSFSMVKCKY